MSPDSRFKSSRSHAPETDSPLLGNTYVPFRRIGDLVFVSGQLPRVEIDGTVDVIGGKAGDTLKTCEAKHAARICGLSILEVLADAIGSLNKVAAVVRVEGFVNSAGNFSDHSEVMNGCSDLFIEVFGAEKGSHSRTAVGCSSLPKGAAVEVSAIFQVYN